MLKRIVNYLKNNRIDCHADKSARNDRVCHYGRFAYYRKFAFTLAETLIVMGIIGVVAALTLPNLNSSTGEKEKVAKVKKIYSNLEDAVGRAQAVYGPFDEWCVNYSGNCKSRIFDRISEFLKTSKKCDRVTSCSVELDVNGSGGWSYNNAAILSDGSVIAIESNLGRWVFKIDIDGENKGPNKQGNDVFEFFVNKEKGVYAQEMSNSDYVGRGGSCNTSEKCFSPIRAAGWILNFDNMDYLKTTDGTTCPDGKTKLTFGGNHSCK